MKNSIPQLIKGVRPPPQKVNPNTTHTGKPAENPPKNPRTPQTRTTNQRVGGTKKRTPQTTTKTRQTKRKAMKQKKGKTKKNRKTKQENNSRGRMGDTSEKGYLQRENARNSNKNEKRTKHTNNSEPKPRPLHHGPSPTRHHTTAHKKQGTHCDNPGNAHPQKPELWKKWISHNNIGSHQKSKSNTRTWHHRKIHCRSGNCNTSRNVTAYKYNTQGRQQNSKK